MIILKSPISLKLCTNVRGQYKRGTQRLFSVNICSKEQILPRNFDSSRKVKNFWMTGQFFEDFQSSYIKFATTSLRISVVGIFTFHSANLAIIRKK